VGRGVGRGVSRGESRGVSRGVSRARCPPVTLITGAARSEVSLSVVKRPSKKERISDSPTAVVRTPEQYSYELRIEASV
jgi:hypothetical protein